MSDGWDRSTADMPVGAAWQTSSGSQTPVDAVPTRFGRYIVVNAIASGGMGAVYEGHDPELDRKVALKIVHPKRHRSPGAQSRLIKEARALARLDHPNVIKVHDVFVDDGQVVIVMELASGETLASWEQSESRTWRETVDVYAQAAKGLASAHALDIVHRDFKPQNVVVSRDGRVRVLDFGLAHFEADEREDGEVTSGSLTQTVPGAIMGTLAYSAPEQLRGDPVTALSDQFSFCVALHRALEGIAPYAGTSAQELLTSIDVAAPTVAKDRLVPAWLRALTARGLAKKPFDRHVSMPALVRQLTRPRGWQRWRLALAVTALLIVGSGATLAISAGPRQASCGDGTSEILSIWNPTIRASVVSLLRRSGTPYADEVAAQVETTLDHRTTAWSETFHATCESYRKGQISNPMFDRETVCLYRSLSDLRASITSLPSVSLLSNAVDLAAGTPDPRLCGDVVRLGAENIQPATLVDRMKVTSVRNMLASASVARRAGDLVSARSTVESAVTAAANAQFKPVLAEARLEMGRVALASPTMTDDDVANASAILESAMEIALEVNATSIAVEAAARRIYVDTQGGKSLETTLRDHDALASLARSLPSGHFSQLLLLNNTAVAYRGAGRPEEAAKLLHEAHELLADASDYDTELTCIDINLAAVDADANRREAIGEEVLAKLTLELGPAHPTTLSSRLQVILNGVRTESTGEKLVDTCADIQKFHPELDDFFYECVHYELPFFQASGNAQAERDALTLLSRPRVYESLRTQAAAQLDVFESHDRSAEAKLALIATKSAALDAWWRKVPAWEAELALGRALTREKRVTEARSHLVNARDGFRKAVASNHNIAYSVWLEQAERLLETRSP